MNKMKHLPTIILLLLLLVILALTNYTMLSSNMPIVNTSWTTGKCVSVENFDKTINYGCNNLPNKYENNWVK